jgi:hypothetical protein
MSKRIAREWVVFESVENDEHNRCCDFFQRTDGSWDFEEFRRDVEDAGAWTPVAYYSTASYPSKNLAWSEAVKSITWLKSERRHLEGGP